MTFNEFLQNYGFYLALVVFSIIAILLIVFLLLPRLDRPKEEGKEEQTINKDDFLALLGGSENIKEMTLRGSRLSVVLNDKSLVELETIKKHGVSRVIVMQNKLVLLVDEAIQKLFNKLS